MKVTLTKPNWQLIVDEKTGMKFSQFFATKNGMVGPTCEKFNIWKQKGRPVKILRMDNGGENVLLKDRMNSAEWKLGITVEFTASYTPQQNSLFEVGFTTISKRGRAMMHHANVPLE